MGERSRRLADEVRAFRVGRAGDAPPGWLELTVYGLAILGFANLLFMALG